MHRIQVTWNNTYFPFTNVSFRRSARRIAGWQLGPTQSPELDFYFTCNGNEHNVFQCGRSVEDDKGNCILKNFGVFCSHCENNHLFSFRLVFIELECYLFTSIKTFFRNRALFQPLLIKLQTRYCNFTFEKQLYRNIAWVILQININCTPLSIFSHRRVGIINGLFSLVCLGEVESRVMRVLMLELTSAQVVWLWILLTADTPVGNGYLFWQKVGEWCKTTRGRGDGPIFHIKLSWQRGSLTLITGLLSARFLINYCPYSACFFVSIKAIFVGMSGCVWKRLREKESEFVCARVCKGVYKRTGREGEML